jgi:hypothetical protein
MWAIERMPVMHHTESSRYRRRDVSGVVKGRDMSATIVGAWRVTVSIPGMEGSFVNLTTFSADGTVLNSFPTPSPAPPGSAHMLEFYSTAVGSWKEAAAGKVALTFETLGVDENGAAIGSRRITATVDLAADGSTWSGPFTLAFLDPAGKQTGSVSGSVSAARMLP